MKIIHQLMKLKHMTGYELQRLQIAVYSFMFNLEGVGRKILLRQSIIKGKDKIGKIPDDRNPLDQNSRVDQKTVYIVYISSLRHLVQNKQICTIVAYCNVIV